MSTSNSSQHEVKPGETLVGIAKQHKVRDWRTIWDAAENSKLKQRRRTPNQIRTGDVIVIPSDKPHSSPAATPEDSGPDKSHLLHMLGVARGKEANFAFGVSATRHKEDVLLVHATRSAQQLREEIKRTTGLTAGNHGICRWESSTFTIQPVGMTQGSLADRLKQYFKKHGISISHVEVDEHMMGTEKVFSVKYRGQTILLSAREKEHVEKKIIEEIKAGIFHMINTQTNGARLLYDRFKAMNSKGTNAVVSWIIETTTSAELPSESVIKEAERLRDTLKNFIDRKVIRQIVDFIPPAFRASNDALHAMQDYRDKMMSGGENWVTALELTKTSCFIIATAIATGGTSLGASVGGSVLIAATESVSTETGRLVAGTKSQTFTSAVTNIGVDTISGLVGNKIGKTRLAKSLQTSVAERIIKSTGSGPLRDVSAKTLGEYIGGFSFFTEGVAQAAKSTSEGQTMDQFVEEVAKNIQKNLTTEFNAQMLKDVLRK